MNHNQTLEVKRPRPLSPMLGYGVAIGSVGLATLAAIVVEQQFQAPNLSLVFVLPVVFAAASFGWRPALSAAVAGVLAYNYFLIAPRYTLRVADAADVWALVLLLTTGAIVSGVAAQSRRRAMEAWRTADQASALHALARALVGESTPAGVAAQCAEALAHIFQAPAVVSLQDADTLAPTACAGGAVLSEADMEAARWSLASGIGTRGGTYPVSGAVFDFWPLKTAQRRRAVIGVRISGEELGRPDTPERLVEVVTGYLSVALDREAYGAQVLAQRVQLASEDLKADLLAAVSHDLKTPLSTILFSLQSLQRFETTYDAKTRSDLLAAAERETARLGQMVENLLDMSRIGAGALPVRLAPVETADLVAAALDRAAPALAGHAVVNETSPGGPLMVDAALFGAALGNVLENAGKYAPDGSTVYLRAGSQDDMGWVEVLDEGPGFTGAPEALFEKFARGQTGDGRAPGTGLGLSIARGFLEAQGGRVEAANRDDAPGARVRLSAPAAERS